MPNRVAALSLAIAGTAYAAGCGSTTAPTTPLEPKVPPGRNVIIVVWDGLRPDAVTSVDTPNLARLRGRGVDFTDNHSTYPTFTMMNAASFATGAFPDATGFYGNVVWQPAAHGNDAAGKPVDYRQPVFSEDYAVLDSLKLGAPQLMQVETLFDAARADNLATAAIGKTGPAYLQDNARAGFILDERTVVPLALANELQAAGIALPPTAAVTYPDGQLSLDTSHGNPVEAKPTHKLADGITIDPEDASGSPYQPAISHLVTAYLDHILPDKRPRLSMVWMRDPDTTEHNYGIGSANWRAALHGDDELLGKLIAKLAQLHLDTTTDIIVVSDHGHSNVSGPQDLFPLRAIHDEAVGDISKTGYSVSGMVRIADILHRAGLAAFDGLDCTWLPVALGLKRDGSPVYRQLDGDAGCKKPGPYQIPPYHVPDPLPPGAIVVAVNGGSDYLYVPDHDPAVVAKAVHVLQERSEVGAIFIDDRYGKLPGTMALSAIHAKNASSRNPDIIFSYDFDEAAKIADIPGTEMGGLLNNGGYRGMHGSFSARDVHNLLIAAGPDFRAGFRDPLPTGNVDVAPTVARLLGIDLARRMPHAQGRVLREALVGGPPATDYRVEPQRLHPDVPATGLTVRLATDPDGKDVAPALHSYDFTLQIKQLSYAGETRTYFDRAKAIRR